MLACGGSVRELRVVGSILRGRMVFLGRERT